ncbi:sugar transporter SWEET1 isoform X2 [Narcine bancroftii]|uniref:sugar transporter SWEET1 isoform X2 n=1 Tax=Narcine bancroftii TaxID=1343680 RepID=UPI003831B676
MEGTLLLPWACIAFTIWMFATGLSDLWSMVTQRSVGNIQFLPYITTALNNLGWFYYGQLKDDWTLMAVNSIGFSLQSCYIMAYLYFTSEKSRPVLRLGMAAGALVAGYLYFTTIPESGSRMDQLGLICSSFTVTMYLSPLADLVKIIQSRSTKCLSFSLTVATLLTSSSWTLYGLERSDIYIVIPNMASPFMASPSRHQIPNMPGIATSLIRFWLFWKYPATDEKYSYHPLLA